MIALDRGRLIAADADLPLLRAHGLTTFEAFGASLPGERGVKAHRRERGTARFELIDRRGEVRGFYIKRHGVPTLRERVKPMLRLQPATFGAEGEWRAMLAFGEAGVPCARPVAMGVSGRGSGGVSGGGAGGGSFVVTAELRGVKLSHLLADWPRDRDGVAPPRALLHEVADLAARMHRAGLHHQDFYLSHLMLSAGRVHVLDLGRARRVERLSMRWIVKDLAQLLYSARDVRPVDHRRFVRRYLTASTASTPSTRLIRAVTRKAAAIARHDAKRRRRRAARGHDRLPVS